MTGSTLTDDIDQIILRALEEDIGDGDITTQSIVPEELWLEGYFVARAAGIVAGLEVVRWVFTLLDQRVVFTPLAIDGQAVTALMQLAHVKGPGRSLLTGERTALNFLQRISGIATLTRRYVQAAEGTKAVILDTRKTAPGLRSLDKLGVRLGGGQNHRSGLYDMALIKNNHIAAVSGDLAHAVRCVRNSDPRHRPVEIEVRSLEELQEALELDVDRILLDNMDPDQLRQAVTLTGGRVPLEASGGINLANVAEIARTGVDYISVGALTHSVQALDISLWIETAER
jgi:nicotinate-nucleotide pyrophosphorylase (carboxylating)